MIKITHSTRPLFGIYLSVILNLTAWLEYRRDRRAYPDIDPKELRWLAGRRVIRGLGSDSENSSITEG